jgi:hypothetical protein
MKCKGMLFRFRRNIYTNAKGQIVETKRMIHLKRESCKGGCRPRPYTCDCKWLPEFLNEYANEECDLMPDNGRDGDIFKVRYQADAYEVDEIWFEKVEPIVSG